eukprot:10717829-Alexandrium_andersonii.AAC.1
MQRAWSPIYAGNGESAAVAAAFFRKYQEFVPQHEPLPDIPLRCEDLLRVFRASRAGAPGSDC